MGVIGKNQIGNSKESTSDKLFDIQIESEKKVDERNYSPNYLKKNIWRIHDLVEYLGCSKGHIYNLCYREKIPHIKKGKFLFFIPEKIHSWILEGNL